MLKVLDDLITTLHLNNANIFIIEAFVNLFLFVSLNFSPCLNNP